MTDTLLSSVPPQQSLPLKIWYWLRTRLFYSWISSITTVVILYFSVMAVWNVFDWAILSSTFVGSSRSDCNPNGACWAFVNERLGQFLYGYYPIEWRWRIDLASVLFVFSLVPIFWDTMPYRNRFLIASLLYPLVAYILIFGGLFLPAVFDYREIGGFTLTLILGVSGIVLSLPVGIVLALGRRSEMPLIRLFCVGFIEFFRGIPLISLLFIASAVLSYFLPPGVDFNLLLRVIIVVVLFSAAYLAEVVRGGLQSLPQGQWEGAASLGLSYWQTTIFIILPQALRVSIPSIVNSFIALLKDTTLVVVIGMADPLGVGRSALADFKWKGLAYEMYFFLGVVFFILCFSIARYSLSLEKRLAKSENR